MVRALRKLISSIEIVKVRGKYEQYYILHETVSFQSCRYIIYALFNNIKIHAL